MRQNRILLTGYKESNVGDISTSKEVLEKIAEIQSRKV